MLVVLAVCLILIGLLLPAVLKAKKQAQVTLCASNLRQVGATCAIYSVENRGHHPTYYVSDSAQSIETPHELAYGYAAFLAEQSSVDIARCPTAEPTNETVSYCMNGYASLWRLEVRKNDSTVPPSHVILMGENRPGSNRHKFWLYWNSQQQSFYPDTIIDTNRHGAAGSNYLFMDYHVSTELPPPRKDVPHPWWYGARNPSRSYLN